MNTLLSDAKSLLGSLDLHLETLCQMVGRVCREAHLSDDDISAGVPDETLEIISDTADEVLAKTEQVVTELRMQIREFLARADVAHADNGGDHG